jgi:hypothetical protein
MSGTGGAAGSQRNKNKAMAADLKARGITRTTGQCPMGCGRPVKTGGAALAAHVGQCQGSRPTDRRLRRA